MQLLDLEFNPETQALHESSKWFLFKGLDPLGFKYYFQQGGIRPMTAQETWITNDWKRAAEHSGFYPLHPEGCMAVMDNFLVPEGRLKPRLSLNANFLHPQLRDYAGEELISWNHVEAIFVSPNALAQIKSIYDQVKPSDITWGKFLQKVTIVEAGDIKELQRKLAEFAYRKSPPKAYGKVTTFLDPFSKTATEAKD